MKVAGVEYNQALVVVERYYLFLIQKDMKIANYTSFTESTQMTRQKDTDNKFSKCSTKPLSLLLTKILTVVKE